MNHRSAASPSSSSMIEESAVDSMVSESCDSDMDPDVLVQTLLELEATRKYQGTLFAGDHDLRARRRKAFYVLYDTLAKSDTAASDHVLEENVPRLLENILVDIKRSILNYPFDTIDHDLKEYSLRIAILFVSKEEMFKYFSLAYTRELVEAAMSTMSDVFQIAPLVVCYSCVLVKAIHQNLPKAYTFIFPSRLCETLVCLIVEAFDKGPPLDRNSNGAVARKEAEKGVGLNTGIAALETLGTLLETHGQEIKSMGGSWATCVFPHLLHCNELVRKSARVVINLTCKLLWPVVPSAVVETCYMALEGPPPNSENANINVETGLPEASLITTMANKFHEAPSDVIATWGFAVHLTSSRLYKRSSRKIVNGLCKVALKAFASEQVYVKVAMYSQWRALIDVFAQNNCFAGSCSKANKYIDVMTKPMLNKYPVEKSPLVRQAMLGAWEHCLERLAIANAITEQHYSTLIRPLAHHTKNDVDLATRLMAAQVLLGLLKYEDESGKRVDYLSNEHYLKCLEDSAYAVAASHVRAKANGDTAEGEEWMKMWRALLYSVSERGSESPRVFALYVCRIVHVLLDSPDGHELTAAELAVDAIKIESIYHQLSDILKSDTGLKVKVEALYIKSKAKVTCREQDLSSLRRLLDAKIYVSSASGDERTGLGKASEGCNSILENSGRISNKRKSEHLPSSPGQSKMYKVDEKTAHTNALSYEDQAKIIAKQAAEITMLKVRILELQQQSEHNERRYIH